MKIIPFIFLILFLSINSTFATKIVSDAKMDSLMESADAVILLDENVFKITDDNESDFFVKLKIRINNKKGENKFYKFDFWESEFVTIDEIEAKITDVSGNEIKELDDDEIEEGSASSGYVLYNKDRYKSFKISHNQYPYILEISYKFELISLFFWSNYSWFPQSEIPVLSSSYKLILEKSIDYKTYSIGNIPDPEKFIEDGDSVIIWRAENIPPMEDEDYLPPENEIQMALLFAPVEFELAESKGSFKTWNDLGKWSVQLYKDKFNLPDIEKQEINNLINGIENSYDKIKILYNYLQNNTRYVAIEVDIGGWQPYSASSTYKNRYGDCKDLSTLMVAMLEVAGIKSFPARVRTRDEGIVFKDFPCNRFNHVITCVPLNDDTLWLECTSDIHDVGEMPYTIEDINALVIKENGGEIIHTPKAPSHKNKWSSYGNFDLVTSGNLIVESNIWTTGKKKDTFRRLFEYNQPDDEKIKLQKKFGKHTPNLTIKEYSYSKGEKSEQPLLVKFNGIYKKAFPGSGSRLFINPNIFNRETSDDIPDEKNRIYPINPANYPYQDVDTVKIRLPLGYKLEAAPEPVELDVSFGRYKTEYKFENGTLFYVRRFEYKENHFPAEMYNDFLNFLKVVVKTDQSKFVFKKG